MKTLLAVTKSLDYEARKSAFRFAAHYFDIRKGNTWMR
jgi:hypothetical protein